MASYLPRANPFARAERASWRRGVDRPFGLAAAYSRNLAATTGKKPERFPLFRLDCCGAAQYIARRAIGGRSRRAGPGSRDRLFYWSHVGPALLAALAIPLGLGYGWLVSPRLDAVIPFWAVPLALGRPAASAEVGTARRRVAIFARGTHLATTGARSLLLIYASIVAIWPIRLLVIEIVLRW